MSGTINITSGGGADRLRFIKSHYNHDTPWTGGAATSATTRRTSNSPNEVEVKVDTVSLKLITQTTLDLNTAGSWDTISGTDYTTAANRAGKDFYVYACQPASGTIPVIKLSAASTYPSDYNAATSRKIAGFHCLCTAVGTISNHTLTDYLAGDVLPQSVWDLKFRPVCNPEGMVYSPLADVWVDIYLASGTGASTLSVKGGTISDTRTWNSFVDDGAAVKKRLLDDGEFQIIAAGSNSATNISGSGDPATTGGHSDTAARRMISNIGCEDCAGAMWQWLSDQSYLNHATTYNGTWSWKDMGAGQLYSQGAVGDVKLIAGGDWSNGTNCGPRSRIANYSRWFATSAIGARFAARSKT